jgi:hypothetical protein
VIDTAHVVDKAEVLDERSSGMSNRRSSKQSEAIGCYLGTFGTSVGPGDRLDFR